MHPRLCLLDRCISRNSASSLLPPAERNWSPSQTALRCWGRVLVRASCISHIASRLKIMRARNAPNFRSSPRLRRNVQIDSVHSDVVNSNGTVWEKTSGDERTIYKVGVAGEESLAIEWHEGGPSAGSSINNETRNRRENGKERGCGFWPRQITPGRRWVAWRNLCLPRRARSPTYATPFALSRVSTRALAAPGNGRRSP